MAFITQSKLKEITYRYKIPVGSFVELYKSKITILDGVEQNKLLQIRCIMEGIDEINLELFEKIAQSRSKKLVYDSNPSYHKNYNCKLLMADYENFYIPDEIISRGDKFIEDFKSWFKENRNLLNKDESAFEMRWNLQWGFPLSIKALREKNTGFVLFEDFSIEQLENKIDSLLINAKIFSRKYPLIIKNYGKYAKKSLSKNNFKPIIEGYDVIEIKKVLQSYVEEIQEPLVRLLISWIRAKFNPQLKFDDGLLNRLGFKPCPRCSKLGFIQRNIQKKALSEVSKKVILKNKEARTPSYEYTRELVIRNLSISEMATIRNVTVKTIVNHLETISINCGVELIEYLRPSKEVLTQVAGAIHLTKGTKRSEIFEFLDGRIDYTEINLALMFLFSTEKKS